VSDPRFLQHGFDKRLSKVIEECGELLHAAGKLQRWGRDSVNPDLPKERQEKNIVWLEREMTDVVEAIAQLRETLVPVKPEAKSSLSFSDLLDEYVQLIVIYSRHGHFEVPPPAVNRLSYLKMEIEKRVSVRS